MAVALVVAAVLAVVRGQYNSLEQQAATSMPPRVQAVRDYLIDRGMYQEAMFHMLSYLVPTDSENTLCSNHSNMYQMAVLDDRPWALRMLDASSKFSCGMFEGNIQELGSYDGCLEVHEPSQLFTGQLCLVQTRGMLPPVVSSPGTTEYSLLRALPLDLTLAVCLPSSCSPDDVAAHWQGVAKELNASATVDSFDCSVKGDIKPGKQTLFAVCVVATLLILVLISSWYDCSVHHQPAKNRRLLVCFSAHTAWHKLSRQDGRSNSLDVLDGVRVLAIAWIVLGHRFEQSLQVPNLTLLDMERYTTAWFMAPILNIMLAVELFFLLSGCLLAFHWLLARDRAEPVSWLHFYYKRFIRLTPALLFVMMLEGCILLYVSDGPLWKRLIGYRVSSCVHNWWTSLLYISNYLNPYNTCLLQTWYLSADTQLYALSPLLLKPMGNPSTASRGLLLLAVCYIATTTAAFANAYYLQLPTGAAVTLDKKTERNHGSEYVLTHVRAASWLTGVALGYILYRVKKGDLKLHFTKATLVTCWVVCLSLCLGAVYSIAPFQSPQYKYHRVIDSLHIALHRNIFSLGAAGIIFLCVAGKGGGLQKLLEWRLLKFQATLSYSVYLSHMSLQALSLARIRQPISFDMFTLWTEFLSDLALSNLAAIIIFFLVESPFWELGQWLYTTGKENKSNEKNEHHNNFNLQLEKTAL